MFRNRRISSIVAGASLFYALCLGVAWECGQRWQDRKSALLLEVGKAEFGERMENLINAVQWYQSTLVFDTIGGRTNATARSVAEMRSLAERLYIDELNIVSTNGRVIASNLPKVVGDDWHANPHTAAFLQLLSPSFHRWRMSQPFRHGTINPEYFCTYHAEAFDDRSGIIQVGYTMDRLAQAIALSDGIVFEQWKVGRHGYYSMVDDDGNGIPDKVSDPSAVDRVERIIDRGGYVYQLHFAYAGRVFTVNVPDREFGTQRRYGFLVLSVTSAVLIFVFALIVFKLLRSNRHVLALRREADERRSADLAAARTIQLSALPSSEIFRKNVFNFTFAAETHPAKEVGGDFYDFYFVSKGRLAIVMADVSGKGISAAMFMMKAKNEIYNALCAEHDLAIAVKNANLRICGQNEAELFVTAWIGVLDMNSGEVEYVNAGHNRPLLRRADGRMDRVSGKGGRFLGLFPEAEYRSEQLMLAPGEMFFLFTDGVTEAMDIGQQTFGETRLRATLSAFTGGDPGKAISVVAETIRAFAGAAEQSDDLTAFALCWHGDPERRSRTFPADTSSLGLAMDWAGGEIRLANSKAKARLLNAFDEIMVNIVSYSQSTEFTVAIENAPGRSRITLTDSGREYNPLSHHDPDTHAPLAERPEGGLGILMTKRLVDAVSYRRDDDRNILVLVKLDA